MNSGAKSALSDSCTLNLRPLICGGPGRPFAERVRNLLGSLHRFGLRCEGIDAKLRKLQTTAEGPAETTGVFGGVHARPDAAADYWSRYRGGAE